MNQAHYVENSAFYKGIGRYVPFPSRSDAMIASIALYFKLGPAVMDVVFLIVNDRSFNASEMTLRKTEDIYIHLFNFVEANIETNTPEIRNRMIESATPRSRSPTIHKSIPPIVLDAVIAWIDESIHERDPERSTLRSLAFVQCRYFQSARRVLGRTIHVKERWGREGLLKCCLANPLAGPWTRQLSLSISIPSDAAPVINTLNIALTKRITGLHKFSCSFQSALFSTDLLENTFSLLGSVSELVLRFLPGTKQQVSTAHHRSIISMPSLKTLMLQYWNIPPMIDLPCKGLPTWFSTIKPSPSFRMLHLYRPRFRSQNGPLKGVDFEFFWTHDSNDNFFLSTLVVHFLPGLQNAKPHEVCRCLLPFLHRLEVLYFDGLLCNHEEYLLEFLDHSPKTLRGLFFLPKICPPEVTLRRIPRTIRRISIRLAEHNNAEWKELEERLHKLISSDAWPELDTLNIHCPDTQINRLTGVSKFPWGFVKLETLCKERGIRVGITNLSHTEALSFSRECREGVLEGLNIVNTEEW